MFWKNKSSSFFVHLNKTRITNSSNGKLRVEEEKYYHRRVIKQSLCINAFRNQKLVNFEDGKSINPIWKQFNQKIRKLENAQTYDFQDFHS
jgi:hypothetical protein